MLTRHAKNTREFCTAFGGFKWFEQCVLDQCFSWISSLKWSQWVIGSSLSANARTGFFYGFEQRHEVKHNSNLATVHIDISHGSFLPILLPNSSSSSITAFCLTATSAPSAKLSIWVLIILRLCSSRSNLWRAWPCKASMPTSLMRTSSFLMSPCSWTLHPLTSLFRWCGAEAYWSCHVPEMLILDNGDPAWEHTDIHASQTDFCHTGKGFIPTTFLPQAYKEKGWKSIGLLCIANAGNLSC